MKLALAQINPIVGDLAGNGRKIIDFAQRAADEFGADLVVFPELSITGYPPHDLLENTAFLDDVERTIDVVAGDLPPGVGAVVGAPVRNREPVGKRLYNTALLLADGHVAGRADKSLLPTYDVYDEYRYFEPAARRACIEWKGVRLGVHICEDMWNMEEGVPFRMYAGNPLEDLVRNGAELLISLSATPYARGKHDQRSRLMRGICTHFGLPLAMVNQVGAATELIFDGGSCVIAADGSVAASAPRFEEALLPWDLKADGAGSPNPPSSNRTQRQDGNDAPSSNGVETRDVHDALVLGIRDYFRKTAAFEKALVGLSGGMDSSLTCALAVEALGAERVCGISMPSEYSSRSSVDDARLLAENLEIEFHRIPIQPAYDTFREMLSGVIERGAGSLEGSVGVTEQNLQARSRGVTLMALSNEFNYLLLATGNKSELAVGYATLYGDMAGGLAVLADIYKTQVYELAHFVNDSAGRELIPRNVFEKPPSAELRPDQTDQDTLPPYAVLDEILQLYIEKGMDLEAIVAKSGHDRALVHSILKTVDRNEYKRRQAPPGLRVTTKALGAGRRMPVVMKWIREATLHPA